MRVSGVEECPHTLSRFWSRGSGVGPVQAPQACDLLHPDGSLSAIASIAPARFRCLEAMSVSKAEATFAAGDVTNVFSEQVLISVGEGAKAALSAYEYLLEHTG